MLSRRAVSLTSRPRSSKERPSRGSGFEVKFMVDNGLPSNVRFADENEAAGAADATPADSEQIVWVTRRYSCDPITQSHAGGTPAT